MRTLIISHNDLDGGGCVVMLDYFNFPRTKLWMVDNETRMTPEFIKEINSYDKVFIVDYSPDESNFDQIKVPLEVFDHHESSTYLLNHQSETCIIHHDQTKCGTSLLYEYFANHPEYKHKDKEVVKEYAHLTEVYDLWKKEDPLWKSAQDLNRVFWGNLNYSMEGNSKYKRAIDRFVDKLHSLDSWVYDNSEQHTIDSTIQKETEAFEIAKKRLQLRVDSKGIKFGITVVDKKISIVASRILEETDIEYVIIVNTYDKTWTKVSIRSKDSFDVTMLKGIKGHKAAGGGSFQARYLVNLWKGEVLKSLPYQEN